ncbi:MULTISPECIES: TetR/AcrR family transcriptional regulator [Enterococcus]|uniref:TetR/AcrR family transcriptional regulator n=1 Tax=Enterococcus TaxID=1350 RepID=UPI0020CCEB68|nr:MULTISPECIES: TetR/AcrR family transcriptional regulator [Enterococcus]
MDQMKITNKGVDNMGRPKEFDTQEVLDRAMDVFWENGYGATSIQDLVDAMGIHRRSIYDTFGDKHNLFVLSLKRYEEMISRKIEKTLSVRISGYDRLKGLFSIVLSTEKNRAGCLIVNSATELAYIDPSIAKEVQDYFDREVQIISEILEKAQEKNQLTPNTNIQALAYYLHNELVGIRVLAKTTNDSQKLNIIIDQTLKNIF